MCLSLRAQLRRPLRVCRSLSQPRTADRARSVCRLAVRGARLWEGADQLSASLRSPRLAPRRNHLSRVPALLQRDTPTARAHPLGALYAARALRPDAAPAPAAAAAGSLWPAAAGKPATVLTSSDLDPGLDLSFAGSQGEYNCKWRCPRLGLNPSGLVNNSSLAAGPQFTEVKIL